MQNYERLYDYIYEYWHFLYDVYEVHAIAYLVTYYNIDKVTTVWDNTDLMGGAYERIGSLSGIKFNKYLILPVFFIEETETTFDAQEIGYVNEGNTGFVIPDQYNITPYPGDMIKLDQTSLFRHNETIRDDHALYTVMGVRKQTPLDKTFWHCSCMVEQSRKEYELAQQLNSTYTFFEYDKRIHTIDNSISLTRMMAKNEQIKVRTANMFDENSGFYYI